MAWHRDGYMTEMAFSLLWSKLKEEEEKGDSLFFLHGPPLPTGMPTLPQSCNFDILIRMFNTFSIYTKNDRNFNEYD